LNSEGLPAVAGYTPLNREPFLKGTFGNRDFRARFSPERLAQWEERNSCPENDKLREEAVWLPHYMLLGTRSDMEQMADAIRKIQKHAPRLLKLS
jgi:hypothetical protein